MNEQQMDAVIAIARRQGEKARREQERREQERDEWNAAVDARKAAKGKKR